MLKLSSSLKPPTFSRLLWMGKKLFIFSLSLSCFANSFCMQEINKPNPAIPIDSNGKEIVADKNGILRLPQEIILEIIKFLFDTSNDELDLKENIISVSLINKFLKNLLEDDSQILKTFWRNQLSKFERIKSKFYQKRNVVYKPINFFVNNLTKKFLLKSIFNFIQSKNLIIKSHVGKIDLLFEGAKSGEIEKVLFALSSGINVDQKDKGVTALMLAAAYAHKEIVECLLNNGAKINEKNNDGKTPLMYAASNSDKEIAKLLLDNGAYIDTQSHDGRTALMFAVFYGRKEMAELLLVNYANVNAKDNDGWTALMKAINFGDIEMARLLLNYVTKVDEKNNTGNTALDIARRKFLEIAKLA